MWTEPENKVVMLATCRNPLCGILFDETLGILGFCSDLCRKRFMAIKIVASLLVPIGKQRGWKLLEEPEHGRATATPVDDSEGEDAGR